MLRSPVQAGQNLKRKRRMTRSKLGELLDQMTNDRFAHAASRDDILDFAEAVQKAATIQIVDQVVDHMQKLQNHLLTTKQAS